MPAFSVFFVLPPSLPDEPSEAADSGPPTEDLLARVRDPRTDAAEAWPELLARCESRLRTLLHFRSRERLRSGLEVEDLLQEAWLVAAEKIDEFEYRGPGSLQRWLVAILRFRLLHEQRRGARRPLPEAALRSQAAPGQTGLFDALARSQPGVSADLRQRESEEQVRGALEQLPEELREPVLLKVYEGLSSREAAERMGLSESAFSKRFHKALRKVGRQLKGSAE